MESYWAKIENNVVASVEVVKDDFVAQNPERYSGIWKKVETKTQPFVSKGFVYLKGKDKIITPKPFESWRLDANDEWEAPKAKKGDDYYWDEEKQEWIENKIT